MRQEKLTNHLQNLLGDAQSMALANDNNSIEPVHVVLAMVDDPSASLLSLFEKAGFELGNLRKKLHQAMEQVAQVSLNARLDEDAGCGAWLRTLRKCRNCDRRGQGQPVFMGAA